MTIAKIICGSVGIPLVCEMSGYHINIHAVDNRQSAGCGSTVEHWCLVFAQLVAAVGLRMAIATGNYTKAADDNRDSCMHSCDSCYMLVDSTARAVDWRLVSIVDSPH